MSSWGRVELGGPVPPAMGDVEAGKAVDSARAHMPS